MLYIDLKKNVAFLVKQDTPMWFSFWGFSSKKMFISLMMLVMEFLPTNLTSCIQQYGILPQEINFSILHDVSLGLIYLHTQTPPIIHRDLSSNNVLLTPNMTAKISDLGVARILNLTPMQMSRMSETPGTPAFMPPEVMVAEPRYDTSVDVFSYGVMMIHVLSGEWPVPKCEPIRTQPDGRMIPVSEAERRREYLNYIGDDHPLMDLIRRCVSNAPQQRYNATEIVDQMKEIVIQFPPSFANRVELMSRIEALENEKTAFAEENEEKDREIEALKEENKVLVTDSEEKDIKIEGLEKEGRALITEKNSEIQALKEENALLVTEKDGEIEALDSQLKALCDENIALVMKVVEKDEVIKDLEEEKSVLVSDGERIIERALENVRQTLKKSHVESIVRLGLAHSTDVEQLKVKVNDLSGQIEMIVNEQQGVYLENIALNESIIRKESEITLKKTALSQKDATIRKLNEQLTKLREYLSSKPLPLLANISWRKSSQLPFPSGAGQTVVIENKVYYGGFHTKTKSVNVICYYDPTQDDWNMLPKLPVKYFGLGHIKGELVAVGGEKMSDGEVTNQVNVFDKKRQQWKQSIPPMRTARYSSTVISKSTVLLVIGGLEKSFHEVDTVELYKTDTSQWYQTDSLPTPCHELSPVIVEDTCYLIGGFRYQSRLNQVIRASIGQLIDNSILASPDEIVVDTQYGVPATWKKLADTPTYQPSVSVISGTLLAIGGIRTRNNSFSEDIQSTVYMYSPSSDSWIYITDIPTPQYGAATAILSPTEIILIGGWYEGQVNTVHKGAVSMEVN